MDVDDVLKSLLQLCADLQDGFWQGAAQAEQAGLAELLQTLAMEWNAFADKVFPILLAVDHTSPDAKWKADPNRNWMNPGANAEDMDDLDVCDECLLGLSLAKQKLQESEIVSMPEVRVLLQSQRRRVEDQMANLVRYVEDVDRSPA